jgi:single-stranded-DNA-specific exonuclease
VPNSARVVGQGHLKLRLAAADAPGPAVDAIGFGLADYLPEIEQGHPFSACYTVELNEYRGQRNCAAAVVGRALGVVPPQPLTN